MTDTKEQLIHERDENRTNMPWPYTGEIRFYNLDEKNTPRWLEFSAYFEKGMLARINVLDDLERSL